MRPYSSINHVSAQVARTKEVTLEGIRRCHYQLQTSVYMRCSKGARGRLVYRLAAIQRFIRTDYVIGARAVFISIRSEIIKFIIMKTKIVLKMYISAFIFHSCYFYLENILVRLNMLLKTLR